MLGPISCSKDDTLLLKFVSKLKLFTIIIALGFKL